MGIIFTKYRLAALICIILLAGCTRPAAQSAAPDTAPRRISAAEAHRMMLTLNDFVLLDVRTEGEFRERRIDGAILIPVDELQRRAPRELSDKNKVILVYCRSGRRSANAAALLASLGYTNVYDFGGILGWRHGTISGD